MQQRLTPQEGRQMQATVVAVFFYWWHCRFYTHRSYFVLCTGTTISPARGRCNWTVVPPYGKRLPEVVVFGTAVQTPVMRPLSKELHSTAKAAPNVQWCNCIDTQAFVMLRT